MATTKNFTSSYVGKAAAKYILPALVGGETLSTEGLSVKTGVKKSYKIKKLSSSGLIQSGSCAYNPTGTITISEVSLDPKDSKVNADICFGDIYALWDSESMGDGVHNQKLPADLEEGIITSFTENIAKAIEGAVWTGNTTMQITGWATDLDNGAVEIVGLVSSALTSTNIVTEMNKVYNALPSAVRKRGEANLVMFMTYRDAGLYMQNLSAQGQNTTIGAKELNLYGIEIKRVAGLPDGDMVLGERANFHLATDLESDFNEVKILDKRDTTGDDVISFIMKWKLDTAVGFLNEVVYYH
jgi:hypothetical protein